MSFMYLQWNKLPNVSTCIDNLGDVARVAHMLKVDQRTVRKWHREGQAPTAVHYAIFWCTVWGRSLLEEQAHRQAQILSMQNNRLERENEKLTQQLRLLENRIKSLDRAANEPLLAYGR